MSARAKRQREAKARLKAFGAFWYDFLVGDDWRLFAGVIVALAITWGVSRATDTSWWIVPVVVALLLSHSIWRAARRSR